MFNWNGIDTNGPVNREQILKWNENNPKFFLIIYLFNGMNEQTTKKEFLDGTEVWLAPPNDVEGKQMITLLLLGNQEAGSMNFVVNNATSVTYYVSNEIKKYFKKAHILPILNPEVLFRGVGAKDFKINFCRKCAYFFNSKISFEKHKAKGCNKKYEPTINVSERLNQFTQFGKIG